MARLLHLASLVPLAAMILWFKSIRMWRKALLRRDRSKGRGPPGASLVSWEEGSREVGVVYGTPSLPLLARLPSPCLLRV